MRSCDWNHAIPGTPRPGRRPAAPRRAWGAIGFSLIELLVVVSILGILAALVAPRFSNAGQLGRGATLREDLRTLRTQILVYRAQHNGLSPGYPNGDRTLPPTLDAFVAQMTLYTDAAGHSSPTASPRFRLGPYLLNLPVNPVNGSSEIRFIADDEAFPAAPAGPQGWVYQPTTGAIAANVDGLDAMGMPYFDY